MRQAQPISNADQAQVIRGLFHALEVENRQKRCAILGRKNKPHLPLKGTPRLWAKREGGQTIQHPAGQIMP